MILIVGGVIEGTPILKRKKGKFDHIKMFEGSVSDFMVTIIESKNFTKFSFYIIQEFSRTFIPVPSSSPRDRKSHSCLL